MKNSNFAKKASWLLTAAIIGGSFFFFPSATSVEQSNSQTIAELSADLADMTAEMNSLKSAECTEVLGQEPFIGEVAMFAGNFAPRGWALCDGQLLPINSNQALFSLLGTNYGGDGRTTFALPDLRGRVPVHPGTGPGLTTHRLGSRFGAERTDIKASKAGASPSSGRDKVMLVSEINQDHLDIVQPSLGVNYIIALVGIFPSRS